MRLIDRVLPERIDTRFRGYKAAVWIFGLVTLWRLAISGAHIFRPDGGAQSVSTIPLDTYPPGAAQNVVALFARMGLEQLLFGLVLLLALARYRAMIPLLFAVMIFGDLALEGVARMKPLALAGASGARTPHLVIAALTIVGFVLSLGQRAPDEGARAN